MAQNVVIRDVTYNAVPEVNIPISGGGTAKFIDTSDATLESGASMLSGVTAYAGGTKITGSIENRTAQSIVTDGPMVTVLPGYYGSQTSKSVDIGSVTAPAGIQGTAATVTTGSGSLTLSKTVSVTPSVTTEGYISEGTPGDSRVSLTASVATKAGATITPGTTDQTIAKDTYLTGVQTIKGDANLVAGNIVSGKTIFGVAGTAQIPVISQDSTTKVLSIS
jgi:hypothetical protein